jgi:hypothetical protein
LNPLKSPFPRIAAPAAVEATWIPFPVLDAPVPVIVDPSIFRKTFGAVISMQSPALLVAVRVTGGANV